MTRRAFFAAVAVLAVLVAALSVLPASAEKLPAGGGKVPLLLISGQNNHDWEMTSPWQKDILEKTGKFSVEITYEPAKALADAEGLKKYKAFVLNYNGDRWGEPAETNFLEAVKAGAGVVVIHAADNAFGGWVEYEKLVGDCWRDGTSHGDFHKFDVKITDRDHPVTKDLPDLKAHPDELYHNLMHMHGVERRVLATAFSSKESRGTGKDEPMITVHEYGQGRVFHTPLGHVGKNDEGSRVTHADVQFQLLLARGTEWAATGKCTIKVVAPVEAPKAAGGSDAKGGGCACTAGCKCSHCKGGGKKPCKCASK